MNDPSCALTYVVHGNACCLLNTGEADIAEVEYDSSFVGLEGGGAVCVEYGRWKFQNFPAGSCFIVHRMTQEDIIYLPMRSGWFQLNIHRFVMADGAVLAEPQVLKATEKWGGFAFSETLLEREPQEADPTDNKEERTTT